MGIFYAKENVQEMIEPLIVANGYEDRTIRRFENYNSRNLPELLGLGTALDFHNLIGAAKKEKRIFDLKEYFLNKIEESKSFIVKTPRLNTLSCGIQNVEIVGKNVKDCAKILDEKFSINLRPMTSHNLNGLRISLSVFNTKADVDYLLDSMNEIAE
jgi:selenocysteine lyase/cysteine desulfurase